MTNLQVTGAVDALTGLATRTAAHAHLQALTTAGEPVTLLLLGIDGFRRVNDTLGASRGDELLQLFAAVLRAQSHPGDVLARLGGDEFAVILAGRSPTDALAHARAVLLTCRATVSTPARTWTVSCSAGLVTATPGDDADTLLGRADRTLREAKRAGAGRLHVGPTGTDTDPAEQLDDDLALALERDQLHVVYQPQVNCLTGQLTGFEALLRWRHPQRGLVSPEVFIPLAEASGLIHRLGHWVLGQAVTQLRDWQRDGRPELTMAVNLSTRQLTDPGLALHVHHILARAGVDPRTVALEVTEGAAMDAGTPAVELLWHLKSLGVKLALDDFGTGHSSLARLAALPIDTVKIDRSFVSPLTLGDPGSHRRAVLLRAAIMMSHALEVTVIAEGAETWQQVALLRALNCDEVQGYYLARPIDPAAIHLPTLVWDLPEGDTALLTQPAAPPIPPVMPSVLTLPRPRDPNETLTAAHP